MYALLVHHFVPENRNLRQWLSNEVIPTLRDTNAPSVENIPSLSSLQWGGLSVPLLHWQHSAWIKWRDMPDLVQAQRPFPIMGTCS
jgi:prophage antirepressor-like protein